MHRYTIPQILALFLGVLSVVARSLPERRLDIDVPSPGGKQSNIPTPSHNHTRYSIPDVNDPKQHPEVLDLVGNIHTTTYSMSNNYTPLPKRDTALEKRLDIQGAPCQTTCVEPNSDNPSSHPNPDDCAELYKMNRSVTGTFTAGPGTSLSLPQDYRHQTDRRSGQAYHMWACTEPVTSSLRTAALTPPLPMTGGTSQARRSGLPGNASSDRI